MLHEKFSYVREKCINGKTYWRCTQYTTQIKCHGRVHTLRGKIVHSSKHNHQPCGQGRTAHLASFSCTRKKKRKLVIDKHEFVMDRKLKSSINWRCSRYRSSNCKVRATTHVLKNGQEVYRLKYAKHSHL
ncbi:hypothetical protein M5D96_002266 [Drosophila gunungcola]|uniref:FLYWCH-type domain-containing protein n=1 Tax=Drosophila gunungcola TaxID=103775 RepID=A0A9P9YZP6_9MUSC|nr:hypothetical protein M5D96_002266 [Drosophila gunungcola]